jgi:3-carboxy-cis,cis-muconate cycloisomerase
MLLAERVVAALAASIGHEPASQLVSRAAESATATGRRFADALAGDPIVAEHLSGERLADVLDPAGYLGSTDQLIDRALAAHGGSKAPRTERRRR